MLPVKIKWCLILFSTFVAGITACFIFSLCTGREGECGGQREKVGFPHELHMGLYDCLECHHVYEDRKTNILDPMELYDGNPKIRCASCHGPEAAIDGATAFHRQCMGCHSRELETGRASGPIMCSECHREEEAIPPEYEMIIGELE